jgi:hypothetical protein
MTTRYDTTWSFQAPVIFATRNDAATYQRVGWRPRVVAQDPNGQFRTIGTGPWQYAWAYDTHPAAFTTQQMFVPRATSASAFASPEFVVIDTQFFSTTTGQLADQDMDWAEVYSFHARTDSSRINVYRGWSCNYLQTGPLYAIV